MIKIIAIGNRLMGDDGVALEVFDYIKSNLISSEHIMLILGETDYMYCLETINDGDLVIIIDSTCLGSTPGKVSIIPLENNLSRSLNSSQHQLSLANLLYEFKTNVTGFIIGIEVSSIDYHFGITNQLRNQLDQINQKVLFHIRKMIKENDYA